MLCSSFHRQSSSGGVRVSGGGGVVSDCVQIFEAAAPARAGGQHQEAAGARPARATRARAGEEPHRGAALCCLHGKPERGTPSSLLSFK